MPSINGIPIIASALYDGSNNFYRDRRKLTFYFIADKRIDFRELVRELFRYDDIASPYSLV